MNIFISYAREDSKHANRLYESLMSIPDVTPWLDSKNLLPGVKWELEIMEALNTCDFFIVLLSSNSVSKNGFIQKEINEALEKLKSVPPDRIFLIPARLNECHPRHPEINRLQWVDLFPDWDAGFSQIVKSILSQKKKATELPRAKEDFTIETITSPANFIKRLEIRREMRGCDSMELEFYNASFQNIDLTGSSFVRCKFTSCNFQDACLKGVNFEGARFEDCQFSGANLWGVNFWGADIRGIKDLRETILKHTNFHRTKLTTEQVRIVDENPNTVNLASYDEFLSYFAIDLRMSEQEIGQTFVWFNHRYFRLMYGKNDDQIFRLKAILDLLNRKRENQKDQ